MSNPVGHPLKFKTPAELDEAINGYFKSCYDSEGKLKKAITYTGLAIAIGTNRQTLLNYQNRDIFFDSLMRAKAVCEEFAESQLFIGKNPSGAQFALQNNYEGWKNKSETELSTPPGKPFETRSMDEGDLDKRIAELSGKAGATGAVRGKAKPKGKKPA